MIVPCTSLACTKRLRMPTGKQGKATCPECKTSRAFDGRACTVTTRDAVIPMREARVPAKPNVVLAALRAIPAGAKILAVLVAAMVIAFQLAKGRAEASLARVGEYCEDNASCRSRLCLHMRDRSTVCTRDCTADSDCPREMRCTAATRTIDFGASPFSHEKLVCVPRTAQ